MADFRFQIELRIGIDRICNLKSAICNLTDQ